MKKHITIIAGHDLNAEREQHTLDWLRKHNVTIEDWNDLQVLSMIAEQPHMGQYRGQWIVGFDDPEGNQEQSYLVIDLEVDPYETRVEVEYEGSYSCSCKGKGCVKCNGEMEAIARGDNLYAHHTK